MFFTSLKFALVNGYRFLLEFTVLFDLLKDFLSLVSFA